MADQNPKHPAEVLADSAHLSYRVGWRRQAEEMLRRIPALEAASAGIADAEAVIAWATSESRKPSVFAFPAGPERQAAYWINWAEKRARQEYHRLMDKHNAALHVRYRAARDRVAALEAERDALKETLHDELAENLALRELGGADPDEGMTQFLRRVIAERDAQRLYARKLCKAIDAIADFAGTVAGGASWWDDVWRAHELDLDAARSALGAASDGESAVDRAIRLEAELQRLKDSIQFRLDEEREACADEADHWLGIDKTAGDACDDIAAAIRARKGSK